MVKKLSDLYLEARRAIMTQEDVQTAGLLARELLCHVTGKTKEQLLTDSQMYASEQTCFALSEAVNREENLWPMCWGSGNSTACL